MENLALVGLSRQVALSRELDVVANNIANLNTPGYKADSSLFTEFLPPNARTTQTSGKVSFVQDAGVWRDLSQGGFDRTGNPLDLAIDGEGFFVVQTPRGERYTRNGSLQISATGQLVTNDGDPVLGDAGPIKFQRTDRQVEISRDGLVTVREGSSNTNSTRGRLRLVTFESARQLQKEGGSLLSAIDDAAPQNTKAAGLVQGSLEKSNVRGVIEMSRMIEITRSYTQIGALMQQQGDLGQQAIDKLAEVPA